MNKEYKASDGAAFTSEDERDWYQQTVINLKYRKIHIEIPEHDILTFESLTQLKDYAKDNYHHMKHEVDCPDTIVFPCELVLFENYKQIGDSWLYLLEAMPFDDFYQYSLNLLKESFYGGRYSST